MKIKKLMNWDWFYECRALSICVNMTGEPHTFIVGDKYDADEVSDILSKEFGCNAPINGPYVDTDRSINSGSNYYEVAIPKRINND